MASEYAFGTLSAALDQQILVEGHVEEFREMGTVLPLPEGATLVTLTDPHGQRFYLIAPLNMNVGVEV